MRVVRSFLQVSLLSVAAIAAVSAWRGAWSLGMGAELVKVTVDRPSDAPETLDAFRASSPHQRLEVVVEVARDSLDEAPPRVQAEALPRAHFEDRYRRLARSKMASLLRYPQLVRFEELVRDPALNPRDRTLHPDDIALLRSVVESQRA